MNEVMKNLCPFCGHPLTEQELKDLQCPSCKHSIIIKEDGTLRLPKHKNE
jgi:DNA-directed RNA polymerase subunit RPC12/RpoP